MGSLGMCRSITGFESSDWSGVGAGIGDIGSMLEWAVQDNGCESPQWSGVGAVLELEAIGNILNGL
jgi:hypothetical protein